MRFDEIFNLQNANRVINSSFFFQFYFFGIECFDKIAITVNEERHGTKEIFERRCEVRNQSDTYIH